MPVKLSQVISRTAQESARTVVKELKKEHFLRESNRTAFQKTERLLYEYPSFKSAIQAKEEQIAEIRKYGLSEKSKSVVIMPEQTNGEYLSVAERKEDKICSLEQSILLTRRCICIVEDSLCQLEKDDYFEIVALKYFRRKTHEEIAELLEKDVSTITRNKNRLVNKLKIMLFSDDAVREIFG